MLMSSDGQECSLTNQESNETKGEPVAGEDDSRRIPSASESSLLALRGDTNLISVRERIQSDVRNAQLTLISILLGAMVAALFIGLPRGYLPELPRSPDMLALDIRAATTFAIAAAIWIQYAWAVIFVHWPFSLLHNVTYFLLSGITMCMGVSVAVPSLWLVWAAITCLGSALAFVLNLVVAREREGTPDQTSARLLARNTTVLLVSVMVMCGAVLYGALNETYCLIPGTTRYICTTSTYWHISWDAATLVFVVGILLVHGLVILPREQRSVGYQRE